MQPFVMWKVKENENQHSLVLFFFFNMQAVKSDKMLEYL